MSRNDTYVSMVEMNKRKYFGGIHSSVFCSPRLRSELVKCGKWIDDEIF